MDLVDSLQKLDGTTMTINKHRGKANHNEVRRGVELFDQGRSGPDEGAQGREQTNEVNMNSQNGDEVCLVLTSQALTKVEQGTL